ncbi:glycosyltransferase [Agreia pratensis]|uniref:D-inositol 3-phosphate glycosyltransferase n=1 Tax=Agreia pratensis TaxID=150121 RepID=A0A1X7K3H6_9MICO|nr:glycosyltransferase [Agreia pratensis]SMG35156.1 D-inositol-3-phosphate glycosyltransferase [Agreia pratensis]
MLRIALVCLHTSPADEPGSGDAGGMNVVVLHQAQALAAMGHDVEIITRRSTTTAPPVLALGERLRLRFVDAGPAEPAAKGDHENFIDEFSHRLSTLGPYDVIHSHHWFSGMAALPVARARRVPHVQSFHSIAADDSTPLSDGERSESPGRMAGESWLARESDAVIAISEAEAHTIETRLGGSPKRITVVSPGVDSDLFAPAASEPASNPRVPYAVVAARLQPLKGLDLAIEAIAAVSPEIRPELVVSGDASADFDGYVDELSRLAELRGIGDVVHFIGPQSREALAELLRQARVVLIPSHSETYGLVALEAAASRVPVVAAASGGLREAVIDGVTGIVLDSRDPQVWAQAITRLISDGDEAKALSMKARERAETLSWSHSAEALLRVYGGLVSPLAIA